MPRRLGRAQRAARRGRRRRAARSLLQRPAARSPGRRCRCSSSRASARSFGSMASAWGARESIADRRGHGQPVRGDRRRRRVPALRGAARPPPGRSASCSSSAASRCWPSSRPEGRYRARNPAASRGPDARLRTCVPRRAIAPSRSRRHWRGEPRSPASRSWRRPCSCIAPGENVASATTTHPEVALMRGRPADWATHERRSRGARAITQAVRRPVARTAAMRIVGQRSAERLNTAFGQPSPARPAWRTDRAITRRRSGRCWSAVLRRSASDRHARSSVAATSSVTATRSRATLGDGSGRGWAPSVAGATGDRPRLGIDVRMASSEGTSVLDQATIGRSDATRLP